MGNVIAVCTSPAKGTQKTNVGTAQFQEDWGIVGTPTRASGTGRCPF